ncbi:MAG: hypothetical protein IKO63_04370 [Paludibacteraceae bacterium]|nr:hypothetical protein [Paludibacteraceae bacterium]
MKEYRKDLLITPSIYTLFLYLLLNDKWMESDYVLHNRVPMIIHDKLEAMGANVYSDFVQGQNNTVLTKLMQNVLYWKYLRYSKNIKYGNVYGNDEYYLSMKYRNQGIKVIEDGPYYNDKQLLRTRRTKQYAGLLNYWFYWLWKDYVPFGFDKRVQVVYHTALNHIPNEIAWKGKLVEMRKLWDGKSIEHKQMIMKVFGLDESLIGKIGKYRTILITQALPSTISESEKVDIYQSLLQENGITQSELLIKSHYAEKTNYRQAFPEATVIDTPVPAQLLDMIGYEADTALTISSSAIFAFVKPNTKIVFKGTEFDERLSRFYGVIKLEDFVKKA